jgi:hypothetical protein
VALEYGIVLGGIEQKTMMRAALVLLICAALLPGETKQERGKRIVDEAIAALGGDAFRQVKNRVESGRAYSFYRDRLTGLSVATISTKYLDEPSGGVAQVERQSFGKDEDYLILFLENGAYQITYRGAKPLPSDRWERYVYSTRHDVFYIFRQRLDEPGMIIEHVESTIWSNIPVDVVDLTDGNNETVTVYFSRSTKLPVRQVFYRRDPQTKERDEYVSIFAKYRDVGNGVQWPYNIVSQRNGDKVFEIFSDSVLINQSLKDEMFKLPSGMAVLPADKT